MKKKQKQSILMSLLMLLITAVALTTASYAWFSVNEAVTLSNLDIQVEAAEGIQVSTDAQTWRAAITVADILDPGPNYPGHTNQIPSQLKPVSTIGSQSLGNFEFFEGTLIEDATTTLTTTESPAEAAGDVGSYMAFDLFIRSATTEDIYLASPTALTYAPLDAEDSVGLELATRVAFFNRGTQSDNDPAGARALAGGTSSTQVIWEPNALENTPTAIIDGATAGTKEPYYGVKAAGTGLELENFDTQTTHFELVTTITPDTDASPFDTTNPDNIIFTVTPGITKVRVYIWIEGQDVDCSNDISLGVGTVAATIRFIKL